MNKLLIIDDEVNLCRELSLFFQSKGYKTYIAHTLEEGLQRFQDARPDLVISDIRLPDGSGLEILRRIITMDPNAYLIMITAYQDMETTVQAMRLGAFDYVHKPFVPEELELIVQKANEHRRLNQEVIRLQAETPDPPRDQTLVGKSKGILEIYKTIGVVSASNTTVLITGESGTGKELVARAIHQNSAPDQPFVSVNFSALVETLQESELFGYEKGAFTGAESRRQGKFESARNGTIFFDEIGDMSATLQTKLLRVLQEREFTLVGGKELITTRARVIAATNRNLESLIAEGRFREDLYYRLKVITIDVLPLRERKDDIPHLVKHFLAKINREVHRDVYKVPERVMSRLMAYDWRGNVRELENVLTRAVVLSRGKVLQLASQSLEGAGIPIEATTSLRSLDAMEAEHIRKVLEEVSWHQGKACEILGISRPTLRKKIRDHRLKESFTSERKLLSTGLQH